MIIVTEFVNPILIAISASPEAPLIPTQYPQTYCPAVAMSNSLTPGPSLSTTENLSSLLSLWMVPLNDLEDLTPAP